MAKCPKCGSSNAQYYNYEGTRVLKCNECDYDEGIEFQQFPTQKTSQREKGRYSPYKAGGSQRIK